jgi:hypothetical protein
LLIINPSWLKSFSVIALLVGALALIACTPPFNWREVRFEEQKIAATFPGKPDSITRTIDLAGTKLLMTMHGVRVKELSYTVAWVKLPDSPSEKAPEPNILAAMQLGMLRNVGAATVDGSTAKTTPIILDAQVPLTDVSGKTVGAVTAKKVLATPLLPIREGNPTLQMSAIFVNHAGYAFQVVAVGGVEHFRESTEAAESAKVFLESVRFIQ